MCRNIAKEPARTLPAEQVSRENIKITAFGSSPCSCVMPFGTYTRQFPCIDEVRITPLKRDLCRQSMDTSGHISVVHVPEGLGGSPRAVQDSSDSVLTPGDLAALSAFRKRGLLDFLMVGDLCAPKDVATVRKHLLRMGATGTKLLLKVNVRF